MQIIEELQTIGLSFYNSVTEIENGICTSLKCDFYFLFRWPLHQVGASSVRQ